MIRLIVSGFLIDFNCWVLEVQGDNKMPLRVWLSTVCYWMIPSPLRGEGQWYIFVALFCLQVWWIQFAICMSVCMFVWFVWFDWFVWFGPILFGRKKVLLIFGGRSDDDDDDDHNLTPVDSTTVNCGEDKRLVDYSQ